MLIVSLNPQALLSAIKFKKNKSLSVPKGTKNAVKKSKIKL
jgi:hypothetical protein